MVVVLTLIHGMNVVLVSLRGPAWLAAFFGWCLGTNLYKLHVWALEHPNEDGK